jgi:histidinol-phosphate aminotransferase
MSAWLLPSLAPLAHGGPDGGSAVRFDFSTTVNAAGPLKTVADAVSKADRTRYPDPLYTDLCEHLAEWHDTGPPQIVVASSASEFIRRFTHLAAHSRRVRRCVVPRPGYGEYAAAAQATGLEVLTYGEERPRIPTADDLWWITEPASPVGSTLAGGLVTAIERAHAAGALIVLDLANQPLRLDGRSLPAHAELTWRLWSPNTCAGLPGVRAAYAIAPGGEVSVAAALRSSAPSWVLGADGVAMLLSFASRQSHIEMATLRYTLQMWRDGLCDSLRARGWQVRDAPSVTPFFVAQPPAGVSASSLRVQGMRVRDTASMGLHGWMRLSAQPPHAIDALLRALDAR